MKKKVQFAISKGCEILLLTTFTLPFSILRLFGTVAPLWNTCLKLTWLRHKEFQNSFTCAKLVHAYKQHLTGLAELIKLCLCSSSPQSLSVSVILCEWCKLLYKIKGHTKYLKASNLLAFKIGCAVLLIQKALTNQTFSLYVGNRHHDFYVNGVRHRSYRHHSIINFLFRFHW